jgi:hypothetical protein
VQSCGCIGNNAKKKHGMCTTPEYRAWHAMQKRCKSKQFQKNYGDRNITVCQRWRDSFENFFADVGPRPSPDHSIDRFPNNDGNYEPGNVRWATWAEQIRNRRVTIMLTAFGRTMPLATWLEESGQLTRTTEAKVCMRLKRGWTHEEALADIVQRGSHETPASGTRAP